jgi:hypothetical protein
MRVQIMVIKTILTFSFLGFLGTFFAQNNKYPNKIVIVDERYPLWGNSPSVHYEYTFNLQGEFYYIVPNIHKKKFHKKNSSKINKKLIKELLSTLNEDLSDEIQVSYFENQFTVDNLNNYIKNEAKNNLFYNEYQRQFLINELTNSSKLKNNIKLFLNECQQNRGCKIGKITEFKISFYFKDTMFSITTNSFFKDYMYFKVNGEKKYSYKLAKQLLEVIPSSETARNKEFNINRFFSSVVENTIFENRFELEFLESKNYQVQLDSLSNYFQINDIRVLDGAKSINWNGEKRLCCKLFDSTIVKNISIDYSTTIENEKIIFPVQAIIKDYQKLYSIVMKSNFFKEYLAKNQKRHISIVYDDNGCFNKTSIKYAKEDCNMLNTFNDFKDVVFIELENEFGNFSRWGILPNGKYFVWWHNGEFPKINYDENFIKCE